MSQVFQKLKLQQTEKSLTVWRTSNLPLVPKQGWVRTVREALGMTVDALATRLSITPTAVRKMEKSEMNETISLKTLQRAAEALDCEIKYALVPKNTLSEIKTQQATIKAKEKLQSISHSMKLEDQEVDAESQKLLLEELVKELLEGNGKKLWK